jgi:hypothetical protein
VNYRPDTLRAIRNSSTENKSAKDGKRPGEKRLTAIDTALTDELYEKLTILKIVDGDANVLERERRTTYLFPPAASFGCCAVNDSSEGEVRL